MDSLNNTQIPLYPYQRDWINDPSQYKEGCWARQTGKSFACAADIVIDSRAKDHNKWICVSSGERQVKEFMEKIKLHAEITNVAISWSENIYGYRDATGTRDEYKITECQLRNGSKIIGVPANPDTARGYSANVYLDEFSVHKNSRDIWAAIFPIVSRRGFKLYITYTPKGKQNKAYEISKSDSFSHHRVDIYRAVKEGCPLDIELLKAGIDDPDLWAQEYEIKFLDEVTAFITYEMINEVETDKANVPKLYAGGEVYVGMDIARRGDLTIIWVLEEVGDVLWTREIIEMHRQTFSAQEQEADRVIAQYKPRRFCMDQTGMGEKFVEDMQRKYTCIEGVLFTAPVKLDLANPLRRKFEDKLIRIPKDRKVRDDIHSVKKITTAAGNIRFDAERSERSHADRFWALALAVHAGSTSGPPAACGARDSEFDWREKHRGPISAIFRNTRQTRENYVAV